MDFGLWIGNVAASDPMVPPQPMTLNLRHLAFAIIAGLTLGNNAPASGAVTASPSGPSADRRAAASPAAGEANKSAPSYKPPCRDPKEHDRCDLEAQWKAADAASDAVWWSMVQAALSAAGIIGLIASLLYTRKAVLAAESATKDADRALAIAARNADATVAHVAVAQDTAKRQLRAHVSVEPGGVNAAEDGRHRVPLLLHNSGSTPAHKVMVFSRFAISADPVDCDPATASHGFLIGGNNDATLGPGVQRWVYVYVDEDFPAKHLLSIESKKQAILHFGYVSYADAFDEPRETHFSFYHWGDELSDKTALRGRLGNYST